MHLAVASGNISATEAILALDTEAAKPTYGHGHVSLHLALKQEGLKHTITKLVEAHPDACNLHDLTTGQMLLHGIEKGGLNEDIVRSTEVYPAACEMCDRKTSQMPLYMALKQGFNDAVVDMMIKEYPAGCEMPDLESCLSI